MTAHTHTAGKFAHSWLERELLYRITELYFGEEASPQRAHLLYYSGWRPVTRPPADRCTTVARWDSWRYQSHWCPAGRGRCPGSQCPNGPNTPPPPHTEDGKREGERGKGHVSQTSRLKQYSRAVCLFWDATKVHESLCKTWTQKLEVLLAAGKILSEKWTSLHASLVLCSLMRSQRKWWFFCNHCSLKHKQPNMGNNSVPSMSLPRLVFSVKFTARRSTAIVRIRGLVPIGPHFLKYVCSWSTVRHFG